MPAKINATMDVNIITPTKHRQLMNFLLRLVMTQHRDSTLKLHFERGAASRYGYRPLKKGYVLGKIKRTGQNVPMVYGGRLRDSIMQTSKVTATATRARLYARGYFPMQDYFKAQIEVITPAEMDEMAERISDRYAYFSTQPEWSRKRRAKGSK